MDLVFNAALCPLVIPANGIVITNGEEEIDGNYLEGATLILDCQTGYTPLGSPSTCQADGSWSPDYRCSSNDITAFNTLKNGFEVMFLLSAHQ